MNRLSLAATTLAAIAVIGLLGLSIARVRELMADEVDEAGEVGTLSEGVDATLVEVDLLAGDSVTFELCASDALDPARWSGAATLVLEAGAGEPRDRVLTEPIDDAMLARARRGAGSACVDFASAPSLGESGHYVVAMRGIGARVAGARVRARVLAVRPLTAGDRNYVLGILLSAIALVIALAMRMPTAFAGVAAGWSAGRAYGIAGAIAVCSVALLTLHPALPLSVKGVLVALTIAICVWSGWALRRGIGAAGAVIGVIAVIDLSMLLSAITPPGPAYGLAAGLALALAEVAIAIAFVRILGVARDGDTLSVLGLQRPTRFAVAIAGFALAPIVGVALRIAAMRALGLIPPTGEAPIEAYVSCPSGMLSFAALSAIAPVGEEVFFRGLVYGAIRGQGGARNTTLAFLGAWLLFVVAHLWQTWGSWGGLAAVAVAGLGFTTLRALTGSVLVAAFAHLVYNGLLAVAALSS